MFNIVLLGSTGSVGRQTLEVVEKMKDVKVLGLACQKNIELMEEQIRKFKPEWVAVKNISNAKKLKLKIKKKILDGEKGILELGKLTKADLIINAISGPEGLKSTLAAINAKKNLALANKESLVMGGAKIMRLAKKNKVKIVPIDSEHTAFFDIFKRNPKKKISKIILPCSGGPFFEKKKKDLEKITVEQALNHPTWKMGEKITIDSATLVNKGFEVIEAMYLFNLKPEQIEVVIHPECIVHAMVIFTDGTMELRASKNDMKIPIEYVINYFKRKRGNEGTREHADEGTREHADESQLFPHCGVKSQLSFFEPDVETFQGLKFGYWAAKKGGDYPKKFCLANEEAVKKFLKKEISFLEIFKEIHKSLNR